MKSEWRERLAQWKNYRYAAFVVLLGAVLMLLPSSEKDGESAAYSAEPWESGAFDRAAIQTEMEEILSTIDGVGALRLMLTVEGSERYLAESSTASRSGAEEWQEKREPLVITRGSGMQEVVVTGSSSPCYLGALVVCEGAGSASVRLAVTEAVAVLTALPSDRITVVQGKP